MARGRSQYDDYWEDFKPSRPRPADGIKAKSQRGSFGSTWWATRWIQALERLMDAGRLARAQLCAAAARCSTWTSGPAAWPRACRDRGKTPYKIAVELAPLTDDQWTRAIDAMAEQAIFAAKLLNGEMPPDIEEAFKQANVALFPVAGNDLRNVLLLPRLCQPVQAQCGGLPPAGGAVRRRPVPAVPPARSQQRADHGCHAGPACSERGGGGAGGLCH